MFGDFRRIKAQIEAGMDREDLTPLWHSLAWITAAIVTTILWILVFLSVTAVILWISWIVDIIRG